MSKTANLEQVEKVLDVVDAVNALDDDQRTLFFGVLRRRYTQDGSLRQKLGRPPKAQQENGDGVD